MRKAGGEKEKETWSGREEAVVMVECISIQSACHAPCILKNIQYHSIISPVYHHLFVS